jgi:hypothetical protein
MSGPTERLGASPVLTTNQQRTLTMAKAKSITIAQTAECSENGGEMTRFDFGKIVDELAMEIQHTLAVIRILTDSGTCDGVEQNEFKTEHETVMDLLNLVDLKLHAMHRVVNHDLDKVRQHFQKK